MSGEFAQQLRDHERRLRELEVAVRAHERECDGRDNAHVDWHGRVEDMLKATQAAYADGITSVKNDVTALSTSMWKKFREVENKAWNALLAAFGSLVALCVYLLGKILHLV